MSFQAGPEADRSLRADLMSAVTQSQATRPAHGWFRERKTIMRNPLTRVATAAAVILAIGIGFIGILHTGGQAAYAFEQTVEAMQGKRSFHIRTYVQSRPKDEFWAEFDEAGRLVRFRQEEERDHYFGPVVTIWEDGVRSQFVPRPFGINLVTRVANVDGELEGLEGFDPEEVVQEAYDQVTAGAATLETEEPSSDKDLITVTVTEAHSLRRVLLVNRATKLLVRMDDDRQDLDGGRHRHFGVDVFAYNEPIDPNLYVLSLPEGTITIDQVSQEVGMAQENLTDDQIAPKVARRAMEAWGKGDYVHAGKLFGGAPPEYFTERYKELRPVRIISIGQPVPVPYIKPWFRVPCQYEVEQDGQITTTELMLNVLAVDGQPGRWYVAIQHKA